MINFLSKEDAQAGFGHSQSEYGAQFCTKVGTIAYFSEVREWSKDSPTARAIIKLVEESDVIINFIGMHGGFQCFDESAGNRLSKKPEPTIYIDLLGKLSVYVRKPHENILSRSQTPHANMSSFNNRIALLHELGHSKQFIERPEWYRFYASAKKKSDFREELETKAKEVWTRKLSPPKPAVAPLATASTSAGSSGGIPSAPGILPAPRILAAPGLPPAPGLPGVTSGLNTRQQVQAILPTTTERARSQSWFVVIDIDNMQRHEWPICSEMGLPIRMHYTDLSA
jgi:hypothetical protein